MTSRSRAYLLSLFRCRLIIIILNPNPSPSLSTHSSYDRLLCTLEWPSIAIAGAGVTQHMPVMLKVLSVRNVMVLIELRTIDCWLGVVRLIPSLTLLERLLQLVHLVLILSSI